MSLTPWRGPGPGRPELPIPPDPMPMLRAGRLRKRWRYVGVYAPEVMLCAARVQVVLFATASGRSGTARIAAAMPTPACCPAAAR